MTVLVIEDSPVASDQKVQDGNTTVEWKLGNLGCSEFTVGIAEFGDGSIRV
jgi:hypothetical protein